MAVADPGKGPGPPPYFWTKLRPERRNKIFFKTAPSPLSQGLNDCAPLPPLSEGLDPPLDGAAKERAYPLSCLTTSKVEVLKTVSFSRIQSVSSRLVQDPKTKKSLTINNISVGKDAWSCVLTQHERRTEINFLKVWNLQTFLAFPTKGTFYLSQRRELRWLKRWRDVLLSME